ncbi:MAG: hypothetical protein IT532_09510 [Burkholderiales bacterium]|nr:hypothetical protein [Burkholderiales bacterium]
MRLTAAVLAAMLVAACAGPSRVLIGTPRTPIDPTQVQVYTKAPDRSEEIAIVEAIGSAFTIGSQARTDALIEKLKAEAAQVGANGIILREVGDTGGASVGAGTGTTIGAGGIGVGVSAPLTRKRGSAMAIYVPSGENQRLPE